MRKSYKFLLYVCRLCRVRERPWSITLFMDQHPNRIPIYFDSEWFGSFHWIACTAALSSAGIHIPMWSACSLRLCVVHKIEYMSRITISGVICFFLFFFVQNLLVIPFGTCWVENYRLRNDVQWRRKIKIRFSYGVMNRLNQHKSILTIRVALSCLVPPYSYNL